MNCMCYCRTLLAGSGLPKMACCKINGYQANLHTIEVGSRGFLHPQSFLDLYKIVKADRGLRAQLEKEVIRRVIEASF